MQQKIFLAAMYLRLSRDDEDKDGTIKSESNSIGSQRELIKSFIREHSDIELYDIYVDDGYSGSNFDRPDFKRMISDIEAGRVTCVIVKDLSRFGRDYIEAGRYIQKTFPALGVRFIAITDHYDSMTADTGESSIVLPIKNFINDSYCRDISTKVKSQFDIKRRNGEYVAPFAVYGYRKDELNKNQLVIDDYAADVVKKIFAWKLEGLANSAIADRLNDLGILSPKEYKKSQGIKFKGGYKSRGKSMWCSSSVKRILTNEVYLGNLVQGKTQKINYKVKKIVEKPENEWVRVENTHEPIITRDEFIVVQGLLKTDGRTSPEMTETNMFTGILFCGDCDEQMVRRVNKYKGKETVYFICSTKNRGEGCSRHSIKETELKELVDICIRNFANAFLEENLLFQKIKDIETNFDAIVHYDKEIARLKEEQDKYFSLCSALYEDLRKGIISKEEFEQLHSGFKRKGDDLEPAVARQEKLIKDMFKQGVMSASRLKLFQNTAELKDIDRKTMRSLVKKINVFEEKRIEIEFYFMDEYKIIHNMNARFSASENQQLDVDSVQKMQEFTRGQIWERSVS